jgi:hypothetical protein
MKTFRDFDLPVKHLEGDGEHYVPPKARDCEEIERRKQLVPGVLMAELQLKGIKIARNILEIVQQQDDGIFVVRTLGAAALNTSWYNYAMGAQDVMRRRLNLPSIDEFGEDVTKSKIITDAVEQMGVAEDEADIMVQEGHEKRRLYDIRKKVIGKSLGNSALTLASVPYADILSKSYDPKFRQYVARQGALEILEESRMLHITVGSNPTLAQLADNDSPLSVYWRRNADDAAFDALEQAIET